jgi:glycosyltransferase involved in cell wall biosynthesis
MKLVIVTQVIDTEHPILGFFHRWVEEFAKHCEHVHIICLQEGSHNLPDNVTVHSLGKESGAGRLTYLWRFYKLIWQLRHEYDNVFVHMNQIYVILGAPFWRLLGKKIGLWYMHGTVAFSLRVAEKLTHKIFTGSPESCRITSDKIVVTGHGIDTTHFAPDQAATKNLDLVTVGRITESKNLIELVTLFAQVRLQFDVSLTIVGAPVTPEEKVYAEALKQHIADLHLTDHVDLVGRVPQADLPTFLNRSKLFVTVAQNGSLDKAILEAMACGLPVVSMAPGTASLPLNEFQVKTDTQFIETVAKVIDLNERMSATNSQYAKANHSIASLAPKIIDLYA